MSTKDAKIFVLEKDLCCKKSNASHRTCVHLYCTQRNGSWLPLWQRYALSKTTEDINALHVQYTGETLIRTMNQKTECRERSFICWDSSILEIHSERREIGKNTNKRLRQV